MSKLPESSELKISEDFRNRLILLMEDNDCKTAKQFANLVGVSSPVISKAINYSIVPSLRMLIKIADKLNLSMLYVIGKSDKNDFIAAATPSSFYERLPVLADEFHVNYGQIASKMPFPRTYIYEWLKDKSLPSLEYLLDLSEYFKITPDYLLGRSDYRD